jgi:hypothetical protein
MAGNAVQIVIQAVDKASKEIQNVNKSFSDMDKTAGGSEKSISGIGSSLKGMVGTLSMAAGAAAAFGMAAKQAFDLGQEGASLLRLEEASGNLAASLGSNMDEVVSAVSRASLGMVSEMDIMQASSRAMMLGVSSDSAELANLMEIAASKARAMGISTTQAFNDIVTGIGRGSPLILDNLGIVINATETNKAYAESIGKTAEQLTEAEKTQALLNSVLTEGNKQLEAVGGLTLDAAGNFEKFAANTKNAGDAFKKNLAEPMGGIIGVLNQWMFGTIEATNAIKAETDAIKASGATKQEITTALREYADANNLVINSEGELTQTYLVGNQARTRVIDENYLMIDSYEALPQSIETVTKAQGASNDVMAANYDHIAELVEGNKALAAARQEAADAAVLSQVANNNLAESLKGATNAQIAQTFLVGLKDTLGETSQAYADAQVDVGMFYGLMDEKSLAISEAFGYINTELDNGATLSGDYSEILATIIADAADGSVNLDALKEKYLKNSEVLPDLSNRTEDYSEDLEDLSGQLEGASGWSQTMYEQWLKLLSMERKISFEVEYGSTGGGGGVAFNQPANTGTRPGMIGTAHGGEGTVPSGYPSDSFPIFTRSGEKVTVQTPPQKFETDKRFEAIIAMLSAQQPATAQDIAMAVRDAIMMMPG